MLRYFGFWEEPRRRKACPSFLLLQALGASDEREAFRLSDDFVWREIPRLLTPHTRIRLENTDDLKREVTLNGSLGKSY